VSFTLALKVDVDRFQRLLTTHLQEIRSAFARGLDRAAEIVEGAAKINLTKHGSVAFGVLRASIGHRTVIDQLRVTIGPGLAARPGGEDPRSYGYYVEHGRGPGKAPPPGALDLWVKRKLGVGDEEEVERLAFLIARKIARSGTTPAPFLVPALRDNEARIHARIDREIDREIERINSQR